MIPFMAFLKMKKYSYRRDYLLPRAKNESEKGSGSGHKRTTSKAKKYVLNISYT